MTGNTIQSHCTAQSAHDCLWPAHGSIPLSPALQPALLAPLQSPAQPFLNTFPSSGSSISTCRCTGKSILHRRSPWSSDRPRSGFGRISWCNRVQAHYRHPSRHWLASRSCRLVRSIRWQCSRSCRHIRGLWRCLRRGGRGRGASFFFSIAVRRENSCCERSPGSWYKKTKWFEVCV